MKRFVVLGFAVLAILFAMSGRLAANDISVIQTNLNTDFTVAGVGGMRDIGNGIITLTNVQGPVTSAYLYWHGPMNSIDPNANAAVFVDGQPITGVNIGFSAPNCWPNLALSQAYRANVTSIVAAKGNGTYQLSGFFKPGNINVNGASLIVFFNDSDPDNNRDVVLFHGNDSNFHNAYDADNWNVFLSGIIYTNNLLNSRAFIQMHVGDGQVFSNFDDDALRINNVVVAPAGEVFSGNSVPSANNGPRNNGSLWDIKTWEITSLLSPGLNSLSITMGYVDGGDCLSLVLAVVDLPAGAIAPKPTCTLICPSDVVANTGIDKCEATVSFPPPTVSGTCSANPVCVPPSGSVFPVGSTVVKCSTAETNCSFKVIVQDAQKPVFDPVSDLTRSNDPGLCSAVVNFTVTARDNCPNATFSCLPASGATFPVGVTTVVCTAIDASNNQSITSFKITVVDNQPPSLAQPADVVKSADLGKTNTVVTFALPVAADNCPGVGVVCAPPSGSVFQLGDTPVTCTATDTSNNKTNVTFKVTVKDNEPPKIVCPADILRTNDLGLCSAVVAFTVTATDNAPGVVAACVPPAGSAFPVGVTTVTCTATDTSDNKATCTFKVTVIDTEKPTMDQPSDIVRGPDPGKDTAVVTFSSPIARDNCPGVIVLCQPPSGSTFPMGTNVVTCTATDTSNNKTNVTFKVIVNDADTPKIVCPTDILKTNDIGLCSAVVTFIVTATDNSPGVTTNCVPPSGSVFPIGVTTVNCTATDTSGNKATCSFHVTVADGQGPTLTQPGDIERTTDPGTNTAVVVFPLPAAQDNCPGVMVVCLPASGFAFPLGATTVTCTATDTSNNKTNVTFKVTVRDNEPPKIVCPADILKTNDLGLCSAVATFTVTATDNVPGVTSACVPPSGSAFPVGVTTVTCTATDTSNNKATCTFKVTVVDGEKPSLAQPSDIVQSPDLGKDTAVVNFPLPSAQDNCPGVMVVCLPASGSIFPMGVTTVTCTATDTSNNKTNVTFKVTVRDNEPPKIVCPTDILKTNDVGLCSAVVTYIVTVTDNAPGVTTNCVPPSGSVFPTGVTTVTCTATDTSGNKASCSFRVTVVDGEKPSLAQPADVVKNTDPGKNTAVVTFPLPAAQDNCPGVTVACTPASGFAFSIGVSTVTCTATDTSNNRTNVTFKVTVKDNEPPKIVCPDMIVTTNDVGLCSAVVRFTVTVTDNAPGAVAVCVPPSGSAFPDGSTFVRCTATDVAGNTASCSFEVVVVDVEPPTLVKPADRVVSTDPGKSTAVVNFPLPTAADNCPGVTVITVPSSGSAFPLGTNIVVATATDHFGNTTSVFFKITVQDTEPPKIVCPDTIVKTNDVGLCSAVARFTVTVTDNVPGVSVVCVPPSGSAFPDGSTLVKCTATDTAGNVSSCTFEVVVVDVEPPSVVQPADVLVSTDPGKPTALVNFPMPPGADNCPGVVVITTPPSGSVFPLGTNIVVTTATDTFGNKTTVTFKATVKDTERPHINCPTPIITGTTPGQCSAKVDYTATATDNVPGVKIACVPPSGSIFPKGTTPVQCTATDTSGNTDMCSFEVTVKDDEKPVLTVPPGVTVNANSNRCDAVVSFTVTATDNCPGVTVACVPPSGSVFPVGITAVQCTATDTSGNTASKGLEVTVLQPAAGGFTLTKTPSKPVVNPGDRVTFTYTVTNGGCTPLTQVDIVDDNATPGFASDDFVVASGVSLAPGEVKTFTKTVIPPAQLCASTSPTSNTGELIATELLPSGDIKVSLIQNPNVNDNTYGANALGWGTRGHTFSDLVGSDHADFSFTDAQGNVVLQFALDFLSASSAFPSGYGSLGVSGGNGSIQVGSAANIASYSTSLAENLNKAPFLNNLAYYKTNSPAASDPNSPLWEYRNIYTVVVKKAAFAAVGFGKVSLTDAYNSPVKGSFGNALPVECNSVSTNTAVATARAGTRVLTTSAKAVVRIGSTCSTCSLDYPYASSNPRTSILFNESEVLRGYAPQTAKHGDKIRVWYNDEHALALGIRQVIVRTPSGTTISNYPVTPLTTNPGGVLRPQVGTTALTGNQAGTDLEGRPVHPALFITDITNDPSDKSGDWQFGGKAIAPHAVYGTWKAGVRTVDKTRTPELVTIDLDNDPAKNSWNLGAGGPVPPGLKDQGYGAEVQWNVDDLGLIPGHTYRFYFMVHDGDQNKDGGDTGHACLNVCFF